MTPELDPIPAWQTRSFWLTLLTAAQLLAAQVGWTFDAGRIVELIMQALPLVTLALAYRERMNPTRRVTLLPPRTPPAQTPPAQAPSGFRSLR